MLRTRDEMCCRQGSRDDGWMLDGQALQSLFVMLRPEWLMEEQVGLLC